MNNNIDFQQIVSQFRFRGDYFYIEPFGCGHINDTYAVYFKKINEHPVRYILQRINRQVFKDPERLMLNIVNVTAHIRRKIIGNGGDSDREVLTVVETIDGNSFYKDADGDFWRGYLFIDDATSYQSVVKPELFYHSARAFGKFQKLLSDFPALQLFETIPDFHNTKKRFEALVDAVGRDSMKRASSASPEIEFAIARKTDSAVLQDLMNGGDLPLKVTHNDTKLNNVMIDNVTGEGICVIDLDTVMPGLSLYDFGDSIRFGTNPAPEDEKDLSKVYMDLSLFEQFVKGYLEEAGQSMTEKEVEYLPFSAKIMTYECGIRFLTDYLNGDIYFKTHREGQNLDRCRTQFKLVADMESKMEEMKNIVQKYAQQII